MNTRLLAVLRLAVVLPAAPVAVKDRCRDDLRLFEFRRNFGNTGAAKSLAKSYDMLRKRQREEGARRFGQARGMFQGQQKEKGHALLQELLEKAPYSPHAYDAVEWLASRED